MEFIVVCGVVSVIGTGVSFYKSREGWFLLSTLAAIGFAVFGAGIAPYVAGQGDALGFAREWAARRPGSDVECQSRDTDDNGYVSCTVEWKDRNGDTQFDAIECGVNRWYCGYGVTGCRIVAARAR